MAQTLIWSQEALDDIDSIAEYISRDSLYHAQQVAERIVNLRIKGMLPFHVRATDMPGASKEELGKMKAEY